MYVGQVARVINPKDSSKKGVGIITERTVSNRKIMYTVLGADAKTYTLADTFMNYIHDKTGRKVIHGPFCTYRFTGTLTKKYLSESRERMVKYCEGIAKDLAKGSLKADAESKSESASPLVEVQTNRNSCEC